MSIFKKNLGIKDLAELAEVSIGTVDRVLHNRKGVSSETKERVLKIVEESGYKKNVMASRLKLASTKVINIAVLIPESKSESDYWRLPLEGISSAVKELSELGVSVTNFFFDLLTPETFSKRVSEIFDDEFDALITVPFFENESNELLSLAKKTNMPVVFLDTERELEFEGNFIRQNSFNAGLVAGRLLHGLVGDEGVYFVVNILNKRGKQINNYQRENGFRAFFDQNIKSQQTEIHVINHAMVGELDLPPKITEALRRKGPKGIFVTNARSFLLPDLLKEHEIINTRVVGFDLNKLNVRYLKSGEIDFLINQKPQHQGYCAVKGLYKCLTENEESELRLNIPVEIVVKENVGFHENEYMSK